MSHRDWAQGLSPAQPPKHPPDVSEVPIVVESQTLFRGHKEIRIRHGDEEYRLRITSNGKLILNK